tara:strand:+ start:217 stop:501 length:285 start_codon:yes stop_codon:yes gene_type:complete
MKIQEINNYRKFNISIISPTDHRGARVKISEPKRYSEDKTKSVILSYSYETGDIAKQALDYLIKKGFKPIARCSEYKFYTILCDNWADEFIELT